MYVCVWRVVKGNEREREMGGGGGGGGAEDDDNERGREGGSLNRQTALSEHAQLS